MDGRSVWLGSGDSGREEQRLEVSPRESVPDTSEVWSTVNTGNQLLEARDTNAAGARTVPTCWKAGLEKAAFWSYGG